MLRPSNQIALFLACLVSVPALAAEDVRPAGAGGKPAAAPATQPTTQSLKQTERADLEKNSGDLRTVGPVDLSEVIRIEVVQGRLAATSPVKTDGDEVRVKLKQSPDDLCTLRVHNNDAPAGMQALQFLRYDFSDPTIVFFHSAVFATPGRLQLVGATEYADGSRQVEVIDQYPSVDEQGNRVPGELNLRVQHIDEESGKQQISVHLRATDLAEMQREHPEEVNAYMRPVLRAFGSESLLSVDPAVAWQVFANEAEPDPKVMGQVRAILPKLDATSFADRADAADQLKKLGAPGALALRHLDRSKLSPEQVSQVDEVLSSYNQVPNKEVEALGNQVGFLLDCMLSNDAKLRHVAYARLQKVTGKTIAFDIDADPATRGKQADVLRKRLMKPPATQTRPVEE